YDLVLIDLPVAWFKWTFHVLSASDGVIVTGTNTIPGLRRIAETVTAIREMRRSAGQGQVGVAVNRSGRRLLGGIERRHHVGKVLGREKVFFVGEDPVLVQAVNADTPLAMADAGRKTSKEIAQLAAFCASLKSTRVSSS